MNTTKTETQDDMVALAGEAAIQADKVLVSKLARDIKGREEREHSMALRPWTSCAR